MIYRNVVAVVIVAWVGLVADASAMLASAMREWGPGEWLTFASAICTILAAMGALAGKIISDIGAVKLMLLKASVERQKTTAALEQNTATTDEIKVSVNNLQTSMDDKMVPVIEKIAPAIEKVAGAVKEHK